MTSRPIWGVPPPLPKTHCQVSACPSKQKWKFKSNAEIKLTLDEDLQIFCRSFPLCVGTICVSLTTTMKEEERDGNSVCPDRAAPCAGRHAALTHTVMMVETKKCTIKCFLLNLWKHLGERQHAPLVYLSNEQWGGEWGRHPAAFGLLVTNQTLLWHHSSCPVFFCVAASIQACILPDKTQTD